mgnify:FL=1
MSIANLLQNWSRYRDTHPYGGAKPHQGYKWAMAIDMDICTGCNACTIACYAENNLAVVGKEKFLNGKSMHWIRIERYWHDTPEPTDPLQLAAYRASGAGKQFHDQGAHFLPMMCQHCEAAPCETVCPVGATNHTQDGINSQIYNRCVGSRYCNVNCPYKVRYFNWFNYQDPATENAWPEPLNQQLNPDVTVRSKGVMEKCTFCVQRLRAVMVDARTQERLVREGEVQTACQQACLAGAISFGNMLNPDSRVGKQWIEQEVNIALDVQVKNEHVGDNTSKRGYRILENLRPYPSVMYLEQVRESAI